MGDPKRQPSSDVVMSWSEMWQFFKSDRCDDADRAFTLKYMFLADCLSSASNETQQEILENAPDWVKNLPDVKKALGKQQVNNTQVTTATKVPMSLLIALAKRNA